MKITRLKYTLSVSLLLISQIVHGQEIANGCPRYDLSMQALKDMTEEIVLTMGYVVALMYAVAAVLSVYGVTVVYIKMTTGEPGVTKSIVQLVGTCLFLISAFVVLPAFFGYQLLGPDKWSWRDFLPILPFYS